MASVVGVWNIYVGRCNIQERIAEDSIYASLVNYLLRGSNTYTGRAAVAIGSLRIVIGVILLIFGVVFTLVGPFLAAP